MQHVVINPRPHSKTPPRKRRKTTRILSRMGKGIRLNPLTPVWASAHNLDLKTAYAVSTSSETVIHRHKVATSIFVITVAVTVKIFVEEVEHPGANLYGFIHLIGPPCVPDGVASRGGVIVVDRARLPFQVGGEIQAPVLLWFPVQRGVGSVERQIRERFIAAVAKITPIIIGIVELQADVVTERNVQFGFQPADTCLIDVEVFEDRIPGCIKTDKVVVLRCL